ncbi:ribosomal protein L20 [Planctopirus limnophila DSM 3776]|jgi:large subunit ribosomal protein L20|uniref:Large ribosomal subunit protein bL20 n=2 Tax=Planctopirus TaxID=1649480 RepID=D5SPV4_PLAL2|nr:MULTISPECIES: 50S ribosomal protein L20 [Planctopirus]ADG68329.1 ribosomal protein L20 [Planctopirus limnophila DSM 3776]QDV31336.1 50S ribosomal protein L20 [Planctopirus ephydatiae]
MRISFAVARHKSHKRLFREARGQVGGRSKQIRLVKETVVRNRCFAFRDRRARKRDFRSLWITRITAAAQMRGLSYSRFINGMDLAGIKLNRKSLSELAIHHPAVFDEVANLVKAALQKNNVNFGRKLAAV